MKQRAVLGAETSGGVGQRYLEAFFYLNLVFVLLSFGAVYPLPLAVSVILACFTCLSALVLKSEPPKTRIVFHLSLWLGILFIGCIVLQTVTLPNALFANAAWKTLAPWGFEAKPVISVAPTETLVSTLSVALPILVFLSGLLIFDTDERAQQAFHRMAAAGGIIALLAIAQFALLPKTLLFSTKDAFRDSLTGTFVNRNTAATFFGLVSLMLFPAAAKAWREVDRSRLTHWVSGLVALRDIRGFHSFMIAAGLFSLSIIALFLTKSRAGAASTFVAFVVFIVLSSYFRETQATSGMRIYRRRRTWFSTPLGRISTTLAIGLFVLGLLGRRTILRAEVGGTDDARFCFFDGVLSAAGLNTETGSGFGAFKFTFTPFRDPSCGLVGIWDKAHNIYLEAFAGLGMVFIPIALAGLAILVATYWIGIRDRRKLRSFPILGAAGLCLVALHGIFDFSLEIPGFAAVYAAFCAVTVTLSLGRRKTG